MMIKMKGSIFILITAIFVFQTSALYSQQDSKKGEDMGQGLQKKLSNMLSPDAFIKKSIRKYEDDLLKLQEEYEKNCGGLPKCLKLRGKAMLGGAGGGPAIGAKGLKRGRRPVRRYVRYEIIDVNRRSGNCPLDPKHPIKNTYVYGQVIYKAPDEIGTKQERGDYQSCVFGILHRPVLKAAHGLAHAAMRSKRIESVVNRHLTVRTRRIVNSSVADFGEFRKGVGDVGDCFSQQGLHLADSLALWRMGIKSPMIFQIGNLLP